MRLETDAWQAFFETFTESAWRLEVQPVYTMPAERAAFERFLAGEPCPPTHNQAWREKVAHYRADGREVGRVRVVRRPLTDYIRYQFSWAYPLNVAAGEDIRILDLTDTPDVDLPDQDFYFFDGQRVVVMMYRPDGTQIGRELLEDPDLATFDQYRATALQGAVPFDEYPTEIRGSA